MRGVPFRALALLAALLAAGVLSTAGVARAEDVVELKSGRTLRGRVVSIDETTIVLESAGASGSTLARVPRAQVSAIRFEAPEGASRDRGPAAERDEWTLLRSGGVTVGHRHLLLVDRRGADGAARRLEENVVLYGSPRAPTVRVQRTEDVDADFLPVHLHYRETGDAGAAGSGILPYETIRSGPVSEGRWHTRIREEGRASEAVVALGAGTRGPLAWREALARVTPRAVGMRDVAQVDLARGVVRTVRAGFVSLAAPGATPREDLFRVEDGERALDSTWTNDPLPRCTREEVAPGVVAEPTTRAKADAAAAAAGVVVDLAADEPQAADSARPPLALPEIGVALALPHGWDVDAARAQAPETGPRLVRRLWSARFAAEVRVEWDPRGTTGGDDPVDAVMARLARVCPDLAIVEARRPAAAPSGAHLVGLAGTRNGERVRVHVLVADHAPGRLVVLATCPESAWGDARDAIVAVFAGVSWL